MQKEPTVEELRAANLKLQTENTMLKDQVTKYENAWAKERARAEAIGKYAGGLVNEMGELKRQLSAQATLDVSGGVGHGAG
jgi:cell division protein FtsB